MTLPSVFQVWYSLRRKIGRKCCTKMKQEYCPCALKMCLFSVRTLRHIESWAQASNGTYFFPAPCDPLPGWRIRTIATAGGSAGHMMPAHACHLVGHHWPTVLQTPSHPYHTKKTWAFLDVAIIIRKLVLPSWLHHIWNLPLMLLLVWLVVPMITVTH